MRERVAGIEAKLVVDSSAASGTETKGFVPGGVLSKVAMRVGRIRERAGKLSTTLKNGSQEEQVMDRRCNEQRHRSSSRNWAG
jgi:hypothetical protein